MPQVQTANVSVFDFGAPVGTKLGTAAEATVTLATAVDGNTVTLSDGTTTVTFEFDDDLSVAGSNVLVDLGASDTVAAANLAIAINASALLMSADSAAAVCTVTAITNENSEADGNSYTATKVGAPITVVDFSGGNSKTVGADVLEFRVKENRGGKLRLTFEAAVATGAYSVSVQVAPSRPAVLLTPSTYIATDATLNLAAVTDFTVNARGSRDATILLRPGVDNYVRFLATGGVRGTVTMRGDEVLEIEQI